MPGELTAPSVGDYDSGSFKKDVQAYRDAISANDLPKAQALRNEIAYRVMGDIESSYGKFEATLTTKRAGFETGSDAVQLGITAATTLVAAGDVKEILAASLSAFQGTRLSIDKNFFQEKTTQSIISQMRATRKIKQAELITNLGTRDVTSYPWDAAWIDLVDFYYAGTVPSALVEISNAAGSKAEGASKTLSNAVAALTPRTPTQAKEAIDIRAAYGKLAAAATGTDAAKSASAVQSLKKILTAVGHKPEDNATVQDLLSALRAAMSEASTDNDKLVTLTAAIAAENLD
jgi:hypothetical protein